GEARGGLSDAGGGDRGGQGAAPPAAAPPPTSPAYASPCGCALSMSGNRVVFRAGRTIELLDAATQKISVLTVARSRPIGLSIEGRRVAWAVNADGRGLVRAIVLPP